MRNDERLLEALEREEDGTEPEAPSRELLRRFERGWKVARLYSAIWNWVGLLMGMWGARLVVIGEDTQAQLRGLLLFLFAVGILIVIKLWWWVAENRIVLLQGVKELQLQVATLEERLDAQAEAKGGRDA